MSSERPKDCVSRTLYAGATGVGFGAFLGALQTYWQDIPKVVRHKAWPGIRQTGGFMVQQGSIFGAVGAAYAAGDCAAETLRGKEDIWNGVYGGFTAGALLGLRAGSLPLAVGAGTALALMSATVDATGGSIRGDGLFDDGLTPKPRLFPYGPPSDPAE